MLNQAVGGFHGSRSVSCHTAPASSHRPAAISSNASVRTDRSPSARAIAYRTGLRSEREAVTSPAPVSATTRPGPRSAAAWPGDFAAGP
ncbi:hypothetical protein [Streptomyces sp. NPDC051577]|uniref:hypothetical protein n=1 Tax=Streptomyces sp. NPDC051577 TaxID=3155166 RepID=UPI00342F833A